MARRNRLYGAIALGGRCRGRLGRTDGPAVPLVVERDREVVVREVLELPEPGRLRVFLEPGGQAWSFLLLARRPGSHVEEIVRQGTPDESGWIELDGLRAGSFGYRVDDAEGGIWKSGEIEIQGGDNPPLIVEIPQIPVTGIVLLGKERVAARILFGAMGEQQIPVYSDEEGNFEASLPRDGRWEMAAELPEAGYVRLAPVQVPKTGGELTLRIPGASVAGRVYGGGKPQANVVVLVQDDDDGKRILGTGLSDADGRFRTTGLTGGKLRVWAWSQDRQSEQLQLELEEGEARTDLRLDLIASQKIRGRLLAEGAPLPGATIFALPVPSQLGRTTAVSGIDGSFEILLPARSAGATLIGLAHGYAAAIENVPPRSGERDLQLRAGAGELNLRGLVCRPNSHTLTYGAASLDLFAFWIALLSADLATDEGEALTLRGLPQGPYLICEVGNGKCSEAVVTAGSSATLEFVPPKEEAPAP